MSVDFEVIDRGCGNFRKPYKRVSLPEKLNALPLNNEFDFPTSAVVLLYLVAPYSNTLISKEELEVIQQLCVGIDALFVKVQDRSVYKFSRGCLCRIFNQKYPKATYRA